MAEAEATTKPVEAVQPETAETETKPQSEVDAKPTDEEKPTEEKTAEEKPTEANSILKTKASINYDNPRKNNKFDPSVRQVTDDPEAIRKQVEFYFGDWNFPQDKFMWETCQGAENKPVPIATLHSFKRMRVFQPYSAVVAALRDSAFLDVSGEEGKEVVKRKTPYKPMPASKAKAEASTVYVKGFGDEKPDTQFELESFFANFGEVKGLKLRRTPENLFKGSVFVTFIDEETAKKFVETDPTPKWQGHDLKVMTKQAYCEEKNDLIRQGKLEPNKTNPKKFFEGKESGGRADKPRFGADDWKKRRDHDQKNGFRGGRGGGRGRGGRGRGNGRGRGGRDGGRDGGRGDNRDKARQPQEATEHSVNDAKPRIQSTTDEGDAAKSNGKRAREDDGAAGEAPAAKKVDAKEE